MTGSLIFTIGFVITASTISSAASIGTMIPAVVAAGVGMATVLGNTTAAGTQNLDSGLVGTGTAILQTSYRIGGSLGSAVVAAILESGTIGTPRTYEWSIWAIVITESSLAVCYLLRQMLGMFSYAKVRSDFVPSLRNSSAASSFDKEGDDDIFALFPINWSRDFIESVSCMESITRSISSKFLPVLAG